MGIRMNPSEIVRHLNAALGSTLVATLAGANNVGVLREWAEEGNLGPSAEEMKRLVFALDIWDKVTKVEHEEVARAWFMGANPWLDDDAPVTAILEGRLKDVSYAAQAQIDETCFG